MLALGPTQTIVRAIIMAKFVFEDCLTESLHTGTIEVVDTDDDGDDSY
jgi:hypothetical protein